MIHFGCPTCKAVLQVPDHQAGTKVHCSVCGQRALVPPARAAGPTDLNKTVLGVVLDKPTAGHEAVTASKPALPKKHPTLRPAVNVPGGQRRTAHGKVLAWLVAAVLSIFVFTGCVVGSVVLFWFLLPASDSAPPPTVAGAANAKNSDPPQLAADPPAGNSPAAGAGAKDPKTGQQIYERVLKSTVWVNNPGMGSGTGILINAEDKLVLTNYHVVFSTNTISQKGTVFRTINDRLTTTDPVGKNSMRYKVYDFQFLRANDYQIDMTSKEFDAFLVILDGTGKVLAFDDDSGGDLNARLRFKPPSDGKYVIIATTYDGRLGNFKLIVTRIDPTQGVAASGPKAAPFVAVNFPSFANGRVIADKAHYMQLNKTDKEKSKGKVVAFSEAKDLAVIQLNHVPADVLALPLARESSKPGQAVHSLGNPGGSGSLWVYTSGSVRTEPYAKRWQSAGGGMVMNHDALIIETQSPTNPGDSGGPLVNDAAELVAVTQGSSLGVNSINLFIDVAEVRAFLKAHDFRWIER